MDIRAPDFHIDGGSFDVKDEGAEFDDSVFDEMVKPEKMEENASLVQPSPALAGTPGFPASAGTAKRPTRKSTLTQQQKNQKRQRATQDQLGTLEVEFNKNPTPNANVRERIAQQINMTERSVQIWFQNRYVVSCCRFFYRARADAFGGKKTSQDQKSCQEKH